MDAPDWITQVAPFWHKEAGASEEAVEQLKRSLDFPLPQDYCDFLLWSNGGEGWNGPNGLSLWKAEEMPTFNHDYQIRRYLPHVVCVGTNAGGYGYGLDYSGGNAPTIVFFGLGGLDPDELEYVAPDFREGVLNILVNQWEVI